MKKIFFISLMIFWIGLSSAYAAPFIRGDANGSGSATLTVADISAILGAIFQGQPIPNLDAADVNDDGQLTVADVVYLLAYIYGGGNPPSAPFPDAKEDPTPDDLNPEPVYQYNVPIDGKGTFPKKFWIWSYGVYQGWQPAHDGTRFYLTEDITVSGNSVVSFNGLNNIMLDLNGHTITYETTPLHDTSSKSTPVSFARCKQVVIKNGNIIQAGYSLTAALWLSETINFEVDRVHILVQGGCKYPHTSSDINVYMEGPSLSQEQINASVNKIHDCYLENNGPSCSSGDQSAGSTVINFEQSANLEIGPNNIIVNGHWALNGQNQTHKERKHWIHHNYVQALRFSSVKTGIGLRCTDCVRSEVNNNFIASDEARGMVFSSGGPDYLSVHHNIVSARYHLESAAGYEDNRPYGIWTRDSWDNEFNYNKILVIDSSPHLALSNEKGNHGKGIVVTNNYLAFTENERINIHDNEITVLQTHSNVQASVGIEFGLQAGIQFGREEQIVNNIIRTDTHGLSLPADFFNPARNNIVSGNKMIKARTALHNWLPAVVGAPTVIKAGDGQPIDLSRNNQIIYDEVDPDGRAPLQPKGLSIENYLGRAVLKWEDNQESDILGYWIYKNGQKDELERYLRRAPFYVDTTARPGDYYQISAQDYSGKAGVLSAPVVFE